MPKPTVLVLGATGFIGTSLCHRLTQKNIEVISFSRSQKGPKKTRHYQGDIRDQRSIGRLLAFKPHVVYLLSGISGQTNTDSLRDLSFAVNVKAQMDWLNSIVKQLPQTKVIFSSSRLEYGKPQHLPVDEKHPVAPLSTYGIHKLMVTQYLLYLHKKHGLDVTILRTSNPYGRPISSGSSKYNIINHFLGAARKNGELTIFGSGKQLRDYLYIEDLIDVFEILITKKNPAGEIYNVGSGQGISIVNMAQKIVQISGGGRIKYLPWPRQEKSVETGDYISDITKIKLALGWEPKTDLDRGIKLSLDNRE